MCDHILQHKHHPASLAHHFNNFFSCLWFDTFIKCRWLQMRGIMRVKICTLSVSFGMCLGDLTQRNISNLTVNIHKEMWWAFSLPLYMESHDVGENVCSNNANTEHLILTALVERMKAIFVTSSICRWFDSWPT